jgi:hypothetical protein
MPSPHALDEEARKGMPIEIGFGSDSGNGPNFLAQFDSAYLSGRYADLVGSHLVKPENTREGSGSWCANQHGQPTRERAII